ncbi:MAG: flagellar hook-length control protein FliK [Butyrivibrio sp.]|nr:flagellar hook-length control protein FliK [Butyrivibrio sp.]
MSIADLLGIRQPRTGSSEQRTTRGEAKNTPYVSAAGLRARGLTSGQTITGKILSLTDDGQGGRMAEVDLGARGTVMARLQDGMGLKEGQNLSFQVRNAGQEVSLSPLLENTSADPTVLKALAMAGMAATEDSLQLVSAMMKAGVNIDRTSILTMSRQVSEHPQTDMSALVHMRKLGIPITEQNIRQFESYLNYEHSIVDTMKEIMDELPDAFLALADSGEEGLQEALALYQDVFGQITEETGTPEPGMAEPEAAEAETAETVESGEITETAEQAELPPEEAAPEEMTKELPPDGETESRQTTAGVRPENTTHETEETDQASGEKPVQGDETGRTAQSGEVPARTAEQENRIPRTDFSDRFIAEVRRLGLSGPELDQLTGETGEAETIDRDALLKELQQALEEREPGHPETDQAWKRLLSDNDFNKLMKHALADKWTLKPEQVAQKQNVESFYSRLNDQASRLTQTLTAALGADAKVTQSASNLQNNIDFMNQLNQMFNYVQLPLRTADGTAHGDLYVYANKKRKFQPGESISAVLHLDMEQLGPLDVFVQMTDTKVRTSFYVADDETIDLISAHIGELDKRLAERGYNCETRLMLHDEMAEDSRDLPVDEMLAVRDRPVISFTSFDARA